MSAAKPLQWRKPTDPPHDPGGALWVANGIGGRYSITKKRGDILLWWAHDEFVWEECASVVEAKAKAEADWQARFAEHIAAGLRDMARDTRPREQEGTVAWDPATSPGMTDMMVSPESLDAFMEANPLPAASFQVPEGWALVPIDPTSEMVKASERALKKHIDSLPGDARKSFPGGLTVSSSVKAKVRFKAMVEAAPDAPVAASFQAGAEAMARIRSTLEEALCVIDPEDNVETFNRIQDTLRSLPIPASSEGR